MEMMEKDIVIFTDDEGNEIELEVLGYFEYEEQEYAILSGVIEEEEIPEEDYEIYVMKVVVDGDMEEFLPADEDKMEELAAIAEEMLSGEYDDCDCDCDCEGDCDCDCENGEECGCGCSCEK